LAAYFPQTATFLSQIWTWGLVSLADCEAGLWAAVRHDAARWLETLLNDPELPVSLPPARPGEEHSGTQPKMALTLLGYITLRSRQYLYDPAKRAGRFPLDEALGLIEGYSPTVAKLMCRAGALAGSFEAASQDLLTYLGLEIDARQIQRMIQRVGPKMAQWRQAQAPVRNPTAGEVFCVSADGTGAPMRRQALRGRKGKRPGQRARTREVKVGAVFTHRLPDPKPSDPPPHHKKKHPRPERDYQSTSYVAQIVSAGDFGVALRAEALRRGMGWSKIVVFLGDGAAWVWRLARLNFPGAICILDFYHAAEHLQLLSNALYGEGSAQAKKAFRRWRNRCRADRIDQVIAEAKADLPKGGKAAALAKKQLGYLVRNRSRMMYETYLKTGYFIGSGVVEAGCKSVVGQRLKQSGMRWGLKGAGHLLTVRAALLSRWFDAFWKAFTPVVNVPPQGV
jgi:hypothetical protein